jgi:hypothetical protein
VTVAEAFGGAAAPEERLPEGGVQPRTARDVLYAIYDAEVGMRPTNQSVKPVHVANGLARCLTERTYQLTALAQTLRPWVKDQHQGLEREQYPNDTILARHGRAFAGVGRSDEGAPADEALSDLRDLLRDALGADDAVFGDADKSSFTLSHARFATRDPSDGHAGLFVERLISLRPDESGASSTLRRLLTSEADPWTALAAPLLELAVERPGLPGGDRDAAAASQHLFALDASGRFVSPTLRALRRGYDRLARHEWQGSAKLAAIRKLVLFGCFSIHVHLASRWSEVAPGVGARPPLFLDFSGGAAASLREGSRATLRAVGAVIEGLLLSRLIDIRDVRDGDLRSLPGVAPRAEQLLSAGGLREHEALAEAILAQGLAESRCHPLTYALELGRRAGYLVPWSNQGGGGRDNKRYGLSAELLEVLVESVLDAGEATELGELLWRLREAYGIVVGGTDDGVLIRRCNLVGRQFGTPLIVRDDHLAANVAALKQALEQIGYAHTYADGTTIVTADGFGR